MIDEDKRYIHEQMEFVGWVVYDKDKIISFLDKDTQAHVPQQFIEYKAYPVYQLRRDTDRV